MIQKIIDLDPNYEGTVIHLSDESILVRIDEAYRVGDIKVDISSYPSNMTIHNEVYSTESLVGVLESNLIYELEKDYLSPWMRESLTNFLSYLKG